MELLLIGIAVSFNILIILLKYKLNRTADALLDLALLGIIAFVFVGSFNALVVGTIGSSIVSIVLFFFNPRKVRVSNGIH